jgi:hypothetical protein
MTCRPRRNPAQEICDSHFVLAIVKITHSQGSPRVAAPWGIFGVTDGFLRVTAMLTLNFFGGELAEPVVTRITSP